MRSVRKWMSALLALLLLATVSVPAALAVGNVYYEATEEVNLRAGRGTQYAIRTSVPKGDVVVVTDDSDEIWWGVSYTKASGVRYEGYINHTYLKVSSKRKNEKKNTAALGCYRAVVSLALYRGPGSDYEKRTTVPVNNVVKVTDTTNVNWYKVDFINKKGVAYRAGYLRAKYLKKAAEPYNVKSKTELRKKASKKGKQLCVLPKGAYVTVTSFYSKYWYKISYTDVNDVTYTGFVLKSKLKAGTVTNKPYQQVDPDAPAKRLAKLWLEKPRMLVTAKTVLRAKASSKGKKVATVPKSSVVAVTSTSNKKWYKVIYNDSKGVKKEGYLPKSALKKYVDPDLGFYVTKVETELRSDDSQTAPVVVLLPQYSLIEVTDSSEKKWYRVKYENDEGEVLTGFVYRSHAQKYEEKNAGTYYTTVDAQLRESASQTGEVILTIPAGSKVKVRRTYNPEWYVVSYTAPDGDTSNGYVYSGYLKQRESANERYVTRVDTPLRALPNDTADPVLLVKEKQSVIVMDKGFNEWWWAKYVDADGKVCTGYIRSAHLMTPEEFEAENSQQQVQAQSDEPEQTPEQAPEQAQSNEPEEVPEQAESAAAVQEDESEPEEAESSAQAEADESTKVQEPEEDKSDKQAEASEQQAEESEEDKTEDKQSEEDKSEQQAEESGKDKQAEESEEQEAEATEQTSAEEPELEAAA